MSYLPADSLVVPHRHIPCLTSIAMIAVTHTHIPLAAGVVEDAAQ
jgi:hypothetical protein